MADHGNGDGRQAADAELEELRRENERLKKEVARLQGLLAQQRNGRMSSRLKDALRE